jgi:hypothetical protein
MTALQQIYQLMNQLSENELVELQAHLIRRQQIQQQVQHTGQRILGLHAGQIHLTEDFMDPLPDDIWHWNKS